MSTYVDQNNSEYGHFLRNGGLMDWIIFKNKLRLSRNICFTAKNDLLWNKTYLPLVGPYIIVV